MFIPEPHESKAAGFGLALLRANNVLSLQLGRRVSGREIAGWLSVGAGQYFTWVHGRNQPDREMLQRLCDLYAPNIEVIKDLQVSYDQIYGKPKRIEPAVVRESAFGGSALEDCLREVWAQTNTHYERGLVDESCSIAELGWQTAQEYGPHLEVSSDLALIFARVTSQLGNYLKAISILDDARARGVGVNDKPTLVQQSDARSILLNRASMRRGVHGVAAHDEVLRMIKTFSGSESPEQTTAWRQAWNWTQRYRIITVTDTLCGESETEYLRSIENEFERSHDSTSHDSAFLTANLFVKSRIESAIHDPTNALATIDGLKRGSGGMRDPAFLARSEIVALFRSGQVRYAKELARWNYSEMRAKGAKYKAHLFSTLVKQLERGGHPRTS